MNNGTIFEALRIYGHDEDYQPVRIPKPTSHNPGSLGKVREMRERIKRGEFLYHADDETMTATVAHQAEMTNFVRRFAKTEREG